jgi:hypothetical protein
MHPVEPNPTPETQLRHTLEQPQPHEEREWVDAPGVGGELL